MIWGCDHSFIRQYAVCSSIPFRLKFLVKFDFSEADVLSWWNFTQIAINISLFKKCIDLRLWLSVPLSDHPFHSGFKSSLILVKLMSYHAEISHKSPSIYRCLKKMHWFEVVTNHSSVRSSVLILSIQVKVFGQYSF